MSKLSRALFGITASELNSAISREIEAGAVFERLEFPIESLRGHHVIQFLKRIPHQRSIAGLGCDQDESIAYQKAVFEYFERKAVLGPGEALGFNSTNGVAAHRYARLAERAAIHELVERDSFLRHWYSKTEFTLLDQNTTPLRHAVEHDLNAIGYFLLLKETYLGFKPARVAFIVKRNTGGFALGLSTGRGLSKDIDKAITEAAINLFFGHEGYSDQELIDDIHKHGVQVLRDHRAYWLLLNPLPAWVREAPRLKAKSGPGPNPQFQRVTISEYPVPVVGVRSDKMLSLVFGPIKDRDREMLRSAGLLPGTEELTLHPIP